MNRCCDIPNPLIRDGRSQTQRQPAMLPPDRVPVDERQLADFLVFAHRFARQIHYYNLQHQIEGDWEPFFARDTPVLLALISQASPDQAKQRFEAACRDLAEEAAPSAEQIAALLRPLFDLLADIDRWQRELPRGHTLSRIIDGLIQTHLQATLADLAGFRLALPAPQREALPDPSQWGKIWGEWPQTADARLTNGGDAESVRDLLLPRQQRIFQTYQQIAKAAPGLLLETIQSRDDHQPHLSLFYAFLSLLDHARRDLNRMTQRHLDYFYQTVLGLKPLPPAPNHVHLVVELAQQIDSYKLDAGTRFLAGQDATGQDIIYQSQAEAVIDRVQIAQLKGLYLDRIPRAAEAVPQFARRLHASPVANSADGLGGDFPKTDPVKAWLPFGDTSREAVTLGFAVASPLLNLAEGNRTITFEFKLHNLPSGLTKAQVAKALRVEFSGEKEWIPVTVSVAAISPTGDSNLKIEAELGADQPAVLPFHRDLPGAKLATNYPVARLWLDPSDIALIPTLGGELGDTNKDKVALYHYLRGVRLGDLTLTVTVDRVYQLLLQNDLAVLEPGKPFQPFGPMPKPGSNFYVGSQEVFSKPLTALTVHLQWDGLPKNLSLHYRGYRPSDGNGPELDFKAKVELRDQSTAGGWVSLRTGQALFGSYQFADAAKLKARPVGELRQYDPSVNAGVMRIQLGAQDFFHQSYPQKLARQVLAAAMKAQDPPKPVLDAIYHDADKTSYVVSDGSSTPDLDTHFAANLNEPYTPAVKECYLSYTAQSKSTAEAGVPVQWFQLHAFDGYVALPPPAAEVERKNWPTLLPQHQREGELLIGLANLDPPQILPLLFQVAEETADTELARAEVKWDYLHQNQWQEIKPHQFEPDESNGLINSGIVNVQIPAEMSRGNTRLDPNLYWLRVSVPERSGAICSIIGVHTQAVKAAFVDEANDPAFLAKPLPAESVGGLEFERAQVSGVVQPYDSFGGRTAEKPEAFYTRTSEHLRHKGRAITIFDYERLVLQAFAGIYKVRCINHTDDQREMVPGHVTLAVVPDLSQTVTTNDLEPKVNVNLLAEVEAFLARHHSPFAQVKVLNPKYEKIKAEFRVRFLPGRDPGYYQELLDQEIQRFLSPWAFEAGAEIHFGGQIYPSSILHFVEERPYVDYVLDFALHQGTQQQVRVAKAQSARSILVSDAQHEITVIAPTEVCPPNQRSADQRDLGHDDLEHLEIE